MSEKEINNLDPNDIGLQQVMGNRFQDMTQKTTMEQYSTRTTNTIPEKKVAQKPISKPVEEQWEPVKATPNFIAKLTDSAKWVCLYGGLSFLIFYWEQAGLMASSIAVPSMCVCTALVGWSIGKQAKRGNR
jgi:hypothetical protein